MSLLMGDVTGACMPLAAAEANPKTQKQSSTKQQAAKKAPAKATKKDSKQAGKTSGGKASAKKKSGGKKKAAKKETSAGVQRQQQTVSKEIALTQQQIEANDVAVSTNLATLQTLESDVQAQQQRVSTLRSREQQLHTNIATCNQSIARSEQRLQSMREGYVRAVKKMRAARKRTNPLAFVFSAKNFYQALRRMRYLRKFASWRQRREAEIKEEILRLDKQKKALAANESALQSTLVQQEEATRQLAIKQQEQAATVSKLRANGDALRAHLAHKQQEANALNARVAQLIAAEQAEAAAAEQRRKEQAARAAAEKAERERIAAEKAEAERIAAEKRAKEQAELARIQKEQEKKEAAQKEQAAKKEQAKKEKAKKEQEKKQQAKKDAPKQEKQKKEQAKKQPEKKGDDKRYADARRRRPRQDKADPAPKATTPKEKQPQTAPKSSAPSGFAAAKGGLPRPVAGQFNIVSRFGRHPLPDLPEVMYDNPGIDAVVAKGASAQAVYPGTVTGVYALPGYSTVVIVSHGEYYTVYGNIGTPAVKKGDSVKAGQALGKLVADEAEGGRTTIHFEVWKNREKQNPESWIK